MTARATVTVVDEDGRTTVWTCRDATAGFDDDRGRLIVVGTGWCRTRTAPQPMRSPDDTEESR